jgi:hypothetical protein
MLKASTGCTLFINLSDLLATCCSTPCALSCIWNVALQAAEELAATEAKHIAQVVMMQHAAANSHAEAQAAAGKELLMQQQKHQAALEQQSLQLQQAHQSQLLHLQQELAAAAKSAGDEQAAADQQLSSVQDQLHKALENCHEQQEANAKLQQQLAVAATAAEELGKEKVCGLLSVQVPAAVAVLALKVHAAAQLSVCRDSDVSTSHSHAA